MGGQDSILSKSAVGGTLLHEAAGKRDPGGEDLDEGGVLHGFPSLSAATSAPHIHRTLLPASTLPSAGPGRWQGCHRGRAPGEASSAFCARRRAAERYYEQVEKSYFMDMFSAASAPGGRWPRSHWLLARSDKASSAE